MKKKRDCGDYTLYYCKNCDEDFRIRFESSDDDESERLSPSEAEDIWLSSGMDEDYDFR